MKHLQDKLQSDSLEDLKWCNKQTLRYKSLVILGFLLVIVPSAVVIYATKIISKDFYNDNIGAFDFILGVRSLTKLVTDIYMFTLFIKTFFFFVDKKRESLRMQWEKGVDPNENDGKRRLIPTPNLSCFNKFVIAYTVFVWLLNVLSSLIVITIFSIYHSSLNEDDVSFITSEMIYILTLRTLTWIINFFTIMGLLYLFYYQGMRT